MSARLALVLAALASSGCTENAILELQFELPAAPPDDGTGEPWYAMVQVRRASDHPFEIPWTGGDLEAIELTGERRWDCISVQSFDESVDLNVRVRFCRSPTCLNLADGTLKERWYHLEHPFYIGRRTYWSTSIPGIPACDPMAPDDADCGGIGVCNADDGQCSCSLSSECPSGMTCVAGNCLLDVGRCQIEGCIEGESTTYCSDGDGAHFCETNASAERESSFNCDLTVD